MGVGRRGDASGMLYLVALLVLHLFNCGYEISLRLVL